MERWNHSIHPAPNSNPPEGMISNVLGIEVSSSILIPSNVLLEFIYMGLVGWPLKGTRPTFTQPLANNNPLGMISNVLVIEVSLPFKPL